MKAFPPLTQSLPPEARLLLCCARTRVDGLQAEEMRSLAEGGIDWSKLLGLARGHGMLPLLYRHLEAHCWGGVPPAIRKQLWDHHCLNSRRNLILTAELLRLVRLLQEHGIAVMPMRGPALAALAYGDVSLRQFGDLDILVHKQDVLRVKDLLIGCGYRPLFPLPAGAKAICKRSEYAFVLDAGRVFVDLHWELTPAYLPGTADPVSLWQRLEHAELEGHALATLRWPELLIHLCMHGAKHHWGRLAWICDLSELTRAATEKDWQGLMARAQALGCRRMVHLGLFLAGTLLGAHISEEVFCEAQNDRKVHYLAEKVCSRLFPEPGGRNLPVQDISFYLGTMDRLRDRIRYCTRRLITPTPWFCEAVPLPPQLFFVYGLLRPVQLAKRYLTRDGVRA